MIRKITYLWVLLSWSCLHAQEDVKGIGFITPPVYEEEASTPKDFNRSIEWDLLDSLLNPTGHCLVRESENGFAECYLILPDGKRILLTYRGMGLVWVGYKTFALQIFEGVDNHYKLELNDNHYWVPKKALIDSDYEAITWKKYYKTSESRNIAVNYNLNLRRSPDPKGEKLALLKINRYSDQFQLLEMTGKFSGNWAQVLVSCWESADDYCDRKEIKSKLKGWIKYLDDTGFPNIFDVPSPCC